MPSKLTADQNSLFLYTIIKTADLKSIQWNQVGKQFNLTNQAAYMRFSRLRTVMEKELELLDAKMAANPAPLTPSKKNTPSKPRQPKNAKASKAPNAAASSSSSASEAVMSFESSTSTMSYVNGGESPTKKRRLENDYDDVEELSEASYGVYTE